MRLRKRESKRRNYPFATIDPNVGMVEVPDARLDELTRLVKPKKRSQQHLNLPILPVLLKEQVRAKG